MSERKAFGLHLRRLRGERSRKEVAAAAKIHPQSLVRLELGVHQPTAATAAALAHALGVDVAEVMSPLCRSSAPPPETAREGMVRRTTPARIHRPRSIRALAAEVVRLEERVRRAREWVGRAYSRCVIAGAPLPPEPPGMGRRHREAWERAVQRHQELAERLQAARTALAEAEGAAPPPGTNSGPEPRAAGGLP